ncbi:hypothetical protein [Staphylococcus hominis]|uniref:hypothetical protein n=1 Tax=Staphylococcus hominis TaxID=1290 RepID=UPI0011AAEF4E|nr:hypothetical protein [Staphylococcus hominis]
MVKIKKKVQMNERGLLKHLLNQENTGVDLAPLSDIHSTCLTPSITTDIRFEHILSTQNTRVFEVEVEEEITKETELPKYLEIYAHKSLGYGDENISIGKNQSIKEILKENKKYSTITKAIHLINDDGTHTLIWKDGELVGDE